MVNTGSMHKPKPKYINDILFNELDCQFSQLPDCVMLSIAACRVRIQLFKSLILTYIIGYSTSKLVMFCVE